jgi:hypothetical protein
MAQKNKTQLAAANAAIDTNGVNAITGAIHHGMNEDMIDSMPSYTDNANMLRQQEAKSNAAIVSASTNTITFDTVIGTTGYSYALYVNCYDTDGNNIDYQITNRLSTGFSIGVPVNCKLDYIATKI